MTRIALVLAIAVNLLHCKKSEEPKVPPKEAVEAATKEPPTPEPPAKTTETRPAPTPKKEEAGPPKVTLLEPGAEPRHTLRYHPAKGAKQDINTEMLMSVDTTLQGATGPTTRLPPMLMTMATEIVDAKDGTFTYDFELTKASAGTTSKVPKAMADAVDAELKKTIGLKGTVTVDGRGFNLESRLATPDKMSPRMKQLVSSLQQSLEQLAAPLPEEPVGKGAKWSVEQLVTQAGMSLHQVATFEVVAISDKSAELVISITQDADTQNIRSPGMPTTAKLHKLRGTGTGKTKLRFDRLAPESSHVEIDTNTSMSLNMGAKEQTLESRAQMSMTLTGK